MQEVQIHSEFIKLQQLLKLAGFIGQGSDIKIILAEGLVKVNGEVATERGKKIRPQDVVVEVKEFGTILCVSEEK